MIRATLAIVLLTSALAGCGVSPGPAAETEFACNAQQRWQNTGVYVAQGEKFRITWVNGLWTPNVGQGIVTPAGLVERARPGSPLPSAPAGSLIGRIGTDTFLIGEDVETIATQNGFLQCSMNDTLTDTYGQKLLDNYGRVTMRITKATWRDRADCPFAAGCDSLWPGRWIDSARDKPLN
ncbi:hypothetical protein [Roseiterribacter gracilis]|uniref:Lipoprotein n=1 Tax=Roseiterribacter gracilis TaxID=2812848 RepID=A0A8S8XA04_9PROT|nr:hypothetical protein TMPK1_09180 [Rhodospirillales bacterium TMPK1]